MKRSNLLIAVLIVWVLFTVMILFSDFEYNGDKLLGFINMTASLLGVIGIYFAYLQIVNMHEQDAESQKIRNEEFDLIKAQKSVELADQFRIIVSDCFLLSSIYQTNEKFYQLIQDLPYGSISSFRNTELQRNFAEKDLKVIDSCYQHMYDNFEKTIDKFTLYESIPKKFEKVYAVMSKHEFSIENLFYSLFDLKFTQESINKVKSELSEDDGSIQKFRFFSEVNDDFTEFKLEIVSLIESKSSDVLNHLEVFAMAINLGLADDEPLYPSLHQAFLDTVRILHPSISKMNDGQHTDHFYVHVRKLFTKWSKRYDEEVRTHASEQLKLEMSEPEYKKLS